jgi:organic radical activating enzyme
VTVALPYVEFYITNVCNFDCTGCNRFNNYTFAGSQRWSDYADIYQQWSQRLTFDRCGVLGGEPMAVPDYMDWLHGIRRLWPRAHINFISNGSLLRPEHRELYDFMLANRGTANFAIGLHNRNRLQEVMDRVKSWLMGPVTVTRWPDDLRELENAEHNWRQSYNQIRAESWPDCATPDQWANLPEHIQRECREQHGFDPESFGDRLRNYVLTDSQGVRVGISWESDFHQGALIPDPERGTFSLHQSDPERAHAICHSKYCHHFDHGQLYKCGPVSLFPQFYEQFNLELSPEDHELMMSYVPATLNMTPAELDQWINGVRNTIPQCRFCPESYHMKEIQSQVKKVHFPKKRNRLTTKEQSVTIIK